MLIAALVFLAVFTLVTLVSFGLQAEPAGHRKMTQSRLAAIPVNAAFEEPDQLKDVFLDNALSSLPWLNHLLEKIDMVGRLRMLMMQADATWTVAQLMMYSLVSALAGFFIIYWRTGEVLPSLAFGSATACIPPGYIWRMRASRM